MIIPLSSPLSKIYDQVVHSLIRFVTPPALKTVDSLFAVSVCSHGGIAKFQLAEPQSD